MTARGGLVRRVLTTRNVGPIDRALRALPAVAVAVLWAAGVIVGPVAVGLGVLAAMLLLTSATGSCSVYYALGVSTRRRGTRPAADE